MRVRGAAATTRATTPATFWARSGARALAVSIVVAGAAFAAWAFASAGAARDDAHDAGADAVAGADVAPAPAAARAALLERLARLNRSERFLFGEENATLWGMYLDGHLTSTNQWFDATARAGRFTSDSDALVGDSPAVLGVSLGMLAFEPVEWNRRAAIAEAIRHQIDAGGVVTLDWHAPSCDAGVRATGSLGTVRVDGRDVDIPFVEGGSLFYAEEEYRRPIASRADVPEPLKCLCQIANDLPLTAGPYKDRAPGITGKTWLIAQAKHAAQVLRDQRLAGLPLIVRPFHEHTGSWFWWGQPYWACEALLGKPGAISGPDAFKRVDRTFVSALRAEPGMESLLFAYSPDKLAGPGDGAPSARDQPKLADPTGHARDLLRQRLTRELAAAGLAYASDAQRAATLPFARLHTAGAAGRSETETYVAQRRVYYAEAYAGDDVFDLLGIDLYHPLGHAPSAADRRFFALQLRVLADEARARGKPYALTEAGTYRMQLAQLARVWAAGTPPPFVVNGQPQVEEALARLFDPADRAELLQHFGLAAPGPVVLTRAERAAIAPARVEDWYNQQLLVLAKEAKVAYALVWQTYYDSRWTDRYFHYYVPYPGHPAAASFKRFYADPATCFLRDRCGLAGAAPPAR